MPAKTCDRGNCAKRAVACGRKDNKHSYKCCREMLLKPRTLRNLTRVMKIYGLLNSSFKTFKKSCFTMFLLMNFIRYCSNVSMQVDSFYKDLSITLIYLGTIRLPISFSTVSQENKYTATNIVYYQTGDVLRI